MNLIQRLSIRIRLFLLAGVPVVGALLLAGMIAQDARGRAAKAAALGTVEDLARLSSEMSGALRQVQTERARAALREGLASGEQGEQAQRALEAQFAATDAASAKLEQFLVGRDLTRLPPRLARDLHTAREEMGKLAAFRVKLASEVVSVDDVLAFYGRIDKSLVAATAALSMLSDDGEILRSISALVALAELSERVSIEHALLANVTAQKQFSPGTFKMLVTLVTEQAIYADVFRTNASDQAARRWDADQESAAVAAALALREEALTSTAETVEIDALAWFDAEGVRIAMLERIEDVVAGHVASVASQKVEATRASIRIGVGLSVTVVTASMVLALLIAGGITRPILALSTAAARVRETKDFAIRAQKTSEDELGSLTDAFNEMLTGIQVRDAELEHHRGNLETLIAARTGQLAQRNETMRVVLDNVEQGLAKISVDGILDPERSARFDALLRAPGAQSSFAHHIAPDDDDIREMLELGWETAREGFFPIDVALDQLPKRIVRDGRHLTLAFRPILRDEVFAGALLVVTDVTAEIQARADQERQREYVAIFERVAQDREGFASFTAETGAMLDLLWKPAFEVARVMAIIHTVKGNAAQWGVSSVARIAHDLESGIAATGAAPNEEQYLELIAAWDAVIERFRALSGGAAGHVELSRADLDDLLAAIWSRAPHEALADKVERLRHEATAVRFHRMEIDIERLALRLGKARPRVVIESNDVRLPASRFGGFWASMVHVVRNAIDHGIETPEERRRAGKPEVGCITLRSTESADHITIECADDGAGIDWSRVLVKAVAAGLPSANRADLQRAIFAPGVSTATQISDVSGRGVGLAAVLERCTALGGTAGVVSTPGVGTRFVFIFPQNPSRRSTAPVPLPLDRAS